MDSSCDSVGMDVPESLETRQKEEPIMSNDTLIGVDLAKSVFPRDCRLAPARQGEGTGACRAASSWRSLFSALQPPFSSKPVARRITFAFSGPDVVNVDYEAYH